MFGLWYQIFSCRSSSSPGVVEDKGGTPRAKSKKKRGKKSGKGKSRGEPDEPDEPVSNCTYENLASATREKMQYSVSCDNILESCAAAADSGSSLLPASYSFMPSSVPQPRLSGGGPLLSPPPSMDADTPTSGFYQNLQEATTDTPISPLATPISPLAAPRDEPTIPLYSNVRLSMQPEIMPDATPTSDTPTQHVYSNLELSSQTEIVPASGGASTQPTPPQTQLPQFKQGTYAEVDIMALPFKAKKPRPKMEKKSSLILMKEETTKDSKCKRSHSMATEGGAGDRIGGPEEEGGVADGGVVYASVNFVAMTEMTKMREAHQDVRHFEGLLERHNVREMEVQRRKM